MNNSIIIAKDVPLTFRLRAREIWVSSAGEVMIIASQYGPKQPVPILQAGYLESLCTSFYFGGKTRQNSIADILLLNGFLARDQYDDFYSDLCYNLSSGNITVVYSALSR